jgi:hypothetical protein
MSLRVYLENIQIAIKVGYDFIFFICFIKLNFQNIVKKSALYKITRELEFIYFGKMLCLYLNILVIYPF